MENHEPAPNQDQLPAPHSLIHRPVSLLLAVDGQPLDKPEAITCYNGTPLYYTTLHQDSGLALVAFTSRTNMLAQVKRQAENLAPRRVQPAFEHICQQPPYNLPEQACFYENINQGGAGLCVPAGKAYSDLTRVGRTKVIVGYINYWNDVISSVSWSRWHVSLYENTRYGGSELLLPAGCNTPDLGVLGWNDRASSIVNWGERF
ncbi:hypothetical protein [Spirosoma flavum]|uniref:Uncharacterized protein n=1 Tax=Spirosoma flavum TaxID=2048557 RepID=A0ABW6AS60_9BACT